MLILKEIPTRNDGLHKMEMKGITGPIKAMSSVRKPQSTWAYIMFIGYSSMDYGNELFIGVVRPKESYGIRVAVMPSEFSYKDYMELSMSNVSAKESTADQNEWFRFSTEICGSSSQMVLKKQISSYFHRTIEQIYTFKAYLRLRVCCCTIFHLYILIGAKQRFEVWESS